MLARHCFLSGILLLTGCTDGPAVSPKPPDQEPPTLAGVVLAWDRSGVTAPAAAVFGPGDTIRLEIDASDNERVRWIGLHFIEPIQSQDSVELTDSLTVVSARASIGPPATFSGIVRISAFARDNGGNRREIELSGEPISVFAPVTRSLRTAPLDVAVRDLAFDGKRGRVYLSQPDSARIAVLSLATMTFDSAPLPPARPGGLDLTASGDSLVVALPETRQLGVLDLTVAAPMWRTIDLAIDTASGHRPQSLRISDANKALVVVGPDAVGSSQVYEYDFATGGERLRTDVGTTGSVPAPALLIRSENRGRILLLSNSVGQIYATQADTFLPPQATVGIPGPPVTSTATGSLFLIAGTVFTGTLGQATAYYPPGSAFRSAISLQGDTAYFGMGFGFLRTRLGDGVTLEKVVLPDEPLGLYAVPGAGGQLLSISAAKIVVVDLGGAAPMGPQRVSGRFQVVLSRSSPAPLDAR